MRPCQLTAVPTPTGAKVVTPRRDTGPLTIFAASLVLSLWVSSFFVSSLSGHFQLGAACLVLAYVIFSAWPARSWKVSMPGAVAAQAASVHLRHVRPGNPGVDTVAVGLWAELRRVLEASRSRDVQAALTDVALRSIELEALSRRLVNVPAERWAAPVD